MIDLRARRAVSAVRILEALGEQAFSARRRISVPAGNVITDPIAIGHQVQAASVATSMPSIKA